MRLAEIAQQVHGDLVAELVRCKSRFGPATRDILHDRKPVRGLGRASLSVRSATQDEQNHSLLLFIRESRSRNSQSIASPLAQRGARIWASAV